MNRIEKVALYSFTLNIFLLIIKLLAAIISGSMALMGDAIHSTTDTLSSLGVFLGLKFSSRKSKKFPLGLYKLENLVSLFISLAIFIAGYEIVREVIFSPPKRITNLGIGLIVEGISIIASVLISYVKIKIGKEENSQGLVSDGIHSRTDALSSIIVFVGLLGNYIGLNVDRIVAVIIVGFIVKSGYEVFMESTKVLLDASINRKDLEKIKRIVFSEKGIDSVEDLIGRNSGRYIFVELKVKIKAKDLKEAHKITERIEDRIKAEIPFVDRVVIHYEPVEKKEVLIALPLKDKSGNISDHFGEAPYFAFIYFNREREEIGRIIIEKNPLLERILEKGAGIEIAKYLIEKEVDILLLKEKTKGKGPLYVLEEHGVKVIFLETGINIYTSDLRGILNGVV